MANSIVTPLISWLTDTLTFAIFIFVATRCAATGGWYTKIWTFADIPFAADTAVVAGAYFAFAWGANWVWDNHWGDGCIANAAPTIPFGAQWANTDALIVHDHWWCALILLSSCNAEFMASYNAVVFSIGFVGVYCRFGLLVRVDVAINHDSTIAQSCISL